MSRTWKPSLRKKTPHSSENTLLQYSCLENPMDGGAWWAAVRGVAKSRTRLSDFTFSFHFHALEKEMATTPVFLPAESQAWESLVDCRLWGSHRVGHDWSDLAVAASQKRYFTLWKCSGHLFYWRRINITKSAGLTVRTIYFEWTEGRNQLFYHLEVTSGLKQRSVPWSPWAKSSFPPAFVNKVLLELSHTHSFRYYLWLPLCYDELSSYKRDHMLQKVKIFTVWSFAEKICWPWSKGVWRLMSISNIT